MARTAQPIVVAGGGCVGLFLALLLAQSPVPNRIVVIEPMHPDPTSTRAMAHQPLIFPLFVRAGLMPELSLHGSFSSGLSYRTSPKYGSEFIVGKKPGEGEKTQLLLPQGKFQEILMHRIRETGKADVQLGSHVHNFTEREDGIDVRIQSANGEEWTIRAEYLIGADGARSTVRRAAGCSFDGVTLPNQLVATDIIYDFHAHGFWDANFIIDSEDYGLIGRITESGLWRVSYGVSNALSEEEVRKGADEKIRAMLPDGGRSGFEVKRVASYKANQLCVDKFWRGRVGLCGDAAHLTNPYAGLGLASGIVDASSLADVLIRVLMGKSPDPLLLLDSWSDARRQSFLTAVDQPSRMAYARVTHDTSTKQKLDELLMKEPTLSALKKGLPVIRPSIETEVENLNGWA